VTGETELLTDGADRPAAGRRLALSLIGAAALSSLVVPGKPPGLGTTLVAFAIAAAIASARPVRLDRTSMLFGGSALALAAMPTLRSAEWLLAVDVLAAIGLGGLAVRGAVSWGEVVQTPLVVLGRLTAAPRFTLEPLVARPGFLRRIGPALRGTALGALLLLVFGFLFANADRAFAEIVGELLVPDIDLSLLPARILVFGVVLLGSGALILASRRHVGVGGEARAVQLPGGLGRTEWITALTLLDLLFAGFVAVQVAVFFGGREHVLGTTGLTFAEYARQGFFQLVAVGALTFAVIAATVRWARRVSRTDQWILRVLLGSLSVLALVILASAFRRLMLYESVFGYTRLRISVHAVIVWMAAVFLALLVAGVRMRAAWLPRAVVALSVLGLMAFTMLDPDRFIASRNVDRYLETGKVDLHYLSGLSADAVPALVRLPPHLASCALSSHAHLGPGAGAVDFTEKGHTVPGGGDGAEAGREARSLLAWNYGRARAMRLIPPKQPAASSVACMAATRKGLW